jgi:hypothetical protein
VNKKSKPQTEYIKVYAICEKSEQPSLLRVKRMSPTTVVPITNTDMDVVDAFWFMSLERSSTVVRLSLRVRIQVTIKPKTTRNIGKTGFPMSIIKGINMPMNAAMANLRIAITLGFINTPDVNTTLQNVI